MKVTSKDLVRLQKYRCPNDKTKISELNEILKKDKKFCIDSEDLIGSFEALDTFAKENPQAFCWFIKNFTNGVIMAAIISTFAVLKLFKKYPFVGTLITILEGMVGLDTMLTVATENSSLHDLIKDAAMCKICKSYGIESYCL